jgi:hypothetical protein
MVRRRAFRARAGRHQDRFTGGRRGCKSGLADTWERSYSSRTGVRRAFPAHFAREVVRMAGRTTWDGDRRIASRDDVQRVLAEINADARRTGTAALARAVRAAERLRCWGQAARVAGWPQRRCRSLRMRARSRRCAVSTSGWRALVLRQRRYRCRWRINAGWLGWFEPAITRVRSDTRPVRSFPSYRGRRNFPGWSATMAAESPAELEPGGPHDAPCEPLRRCSGQTTVGRFDQLAGYICWLRLRDRRSRAPRRCRQWHRRGCRGVRISSTRRGQGCADEARLARACRSSRAQTTRYG